MDRVRLVGAALRGRLVRAATAAGCAILLWATEAPAQGAMDDAGRVFRQALRWPVAMAKEHWYYILGGLLVLLVLRSYLRR